MIKTWQAVYDDFSETVVKSPMPCLILYIIYSRSELVLDELCSVCQSNMYIPDLTKGQTSFGFLYPFSYNEEGS